MPPALMTPARGTTAHGMPVRGTEQDEPIVAAVEAAPRRKSAAARSCAGAKLQARSPKHFAKRKARIGMIELWLPFEEGRAHDSDRTALRRAARGLAGAAAPGGGPGEYAGTDGAPERARL